MQHEGKYIYGIIAADNELNFGPIGIGGENDTVTTIGASGLAAVVSNASMDHYVLSQANLTAHTRVIEQIMESYTVLPMRFLTVSETPAEIITFLKTHAKELNKLLKTVEGKVEIDIKIFWKNMKNIYQEIGQENKKIRELKAKGATDDRTMLIHAGEMVATALEEKRGVEGERYLASLKKLAVDYTENTVKGDDMVLHSAFLLDRTWLKAFDNVVEMLERQFKERIQIRYVGPMAPFSFLKMEILN